MLETAPHCSLTEELACTGPGDATVPGEVPDGIAGAAAQAESVVTALAAISAAWPKNFAIDRTAVPLRFFGKMPLTKDASGSDRLRPGSLYAPQNADAISSCFSSRGLGQGTFLPHCNVLVKYVSSLPYFLVVQRHLWALCSTSERGRTQEDKQGHKMKITRQQGQLLRLLQEDASLSHEALAEKLSKSRSAVGRDLKDLEDARIIERRTVVIDAQKVDLSSTST